MERQQRHLLVEELFQAALALPLDQRAAFLSSSCGHDSDLLNEVQSLISSDQEAQSFLSSSPLKPTAGILLDQTLEAIAGRTFGHYQIIDLLGRGGMGEVYRARDTRLARDVAIKFVRSDVALDLTRLQRLEREARMLASLNHPNIATIHGLEHLEDRWLLIMELAEGETLAQTIARGPMTVQQALPIFRQIAEALEAAHVKGVIHRDLKPANVKLSPDGKVKLLDFGLAKALDAEPIIEAARLVAGDSAGFDRIESLTESGLVLGTPAYMSPEQARGEDVDERTDIWAFGCVLYEALTGKQAFAGKSIAEILANILREEPEWTALPADTPEPVAKLLGRCLKKESGERVQGVAEARTEIEECISGLTESAGRPVAHPIHSPPRRRAALALSIALLALVGILLAFDVGGLRRRPAADAGSAKIGSLAVLPLKPLGKDAGDEILGMGITDAIINRVSQAGDLIVRPTSAVRKYATQETDALAAARELQAEAVLDGAVQRSGENLRVSVNLLRASDGTSLYSDRFDLRFTEIFAIQDEVAHQVTTRLQRKLSAAAQAGVARRETTNAEAYEYLIRGNYSFDKRDFGGNPDLDTAVAMYKRAVEFDPNYGLAHARLAQCYAWKASFTDVEDPRWIALAREELRQAESVTPGLPEISYGRAMILWSRYEGFNITAAIRELRRTQQLDPNATNEILPGMLNHLGLGVAIEEARRAVEVDPTSQNAKAQLVETYDHTGRFDEAISECERLFHGQPPVEYLIGRGGPAFSLMRRGRASEAAEIVNEKLAKEPGYIRAQSSNVLLLAMQGSFRKAEALIPAISARFRNSFAYHHATYDFACACAVAGKAHQAVEWLRTTVEYGWPDYPLFNIDPLLDRIRGDREFIQFMEDFKPRWEDLKREFDS